MVRKVAVDSRNLIINFHYNFSALIGGKRKRKRLA